MSVSLYVDKIRSIFYSKRAKKGMRSKKAAFFLTAKKFK